MMNEPEKPESHPGTFITIPGRLFEALNNLLELSGSASERFCEFSNDTGPKNAFALAEEMRRLRDHRYRCENLIDDYNRSEIVLDETGAMVAILKR